MVGPRRTLLLSQSDVARCIDIKAVLPIVRQVLRAHAEGQVVMPSKITLDLASQGHHFWSNAMPAYVAPFGALGVKWVSGLLDNPATHNLPFILGTILLQDLETGLLLSVMDGTCITNLRTGAAAATAASLVAAPSADSVAIIGAGAQGRASLLALGNVMTIREARVADLRFDVAKQYAEDLSAELAVPVKAIASVQKAVEGADIVITATPSSHVVSNNWLKAGATAIALGSYQEFDDEFVLSADRILVDNLEQATHRGTLAPLFQSGKLTADDVDATVAEVAVGRRSGRTSETQRVLSVLVGLGSLDLAIASVVYGRARELGLGCEFSFVGD